MWHIHKKWGDDLVPIIFRSNFDQSAKSLVSFDGKGVQQLLDSKISLLTLQHYNTNTYIPYQQLQ